MGWKPSGCMHNLPIQWCSENPTFPLHSQQYNIYFHGINSTQIINQNFASQLEHFIMDFHYFITIWCFHEWIHKICYSWQFKLYLLVTSLNYSIQLCIYYKKSTVSKPLLVNDPKIWKKSFLSPQTNKGNPTKPNTTGIIFNSNITNDIKFSRNCTHTYTFTRFRKLSTKHKHTYI